MSRNEKVVGPNRRTLSGQGLANLAIVVSGDSVESHNVQVSHELREFLPVSVHLHRVLYTVAKLGMGNG